MSQGFNPVLKKRQYTSGIMEGRLDKVALLVTDHPLDNSSPFVMCQNFSFLFVTVKIGQYLFRLAYNFTLIVFNRFIRRALKRFWGKNLHFFHHLINDNAVARTTLTSTGLLITLKIKVNKI